MKIALVLTEVHPEDKETSSFSLVENIADAAKASCDGIFFPRLTMEEKQGDPIEAKLSKLSFLHSLDIGVGAKKEEGEEYLIFQENGDVQRLSLPKERDFSFCGKPWRILLSPQEEFQGFSLLLPEAELKAEDHPNPKEAKDCFVLTPFEQEKGMAGAYRNGKLLCRIPKGRDGLFIKTVA